MLRSTLYALRSLAFVFAMIVIVKFANAQECGMDSVNMKSYLTFLSNLEQVPTAASALQQVYRIPIRVIIVNDDQGGFVSPFGNNIKGQINSIVNEANSFFEGEMKFFICSFDEINSSQFHNCDNLFEHVTLSNQHSEPNVINLYFTSTARGNPTGGFSSFSWNNHDGITVGRGATGALVAHELGHYFGLLHTWTGFELNPDNTWNSQLVSAYCNCCDCSSDPDPFVGHDCFDCGEPCAGCNAFNSGDFISDTPVDPGSDWCNDCDDETCELDFFGYSAVFTPNYSNIMSDYPCQSMFTSEQLMRMKESLLDVRSWLIDAEIPTCEIITARRGTVNLVSETSAGIEFSAFPGNTVSIIDPSENNVCSFSTNSTGNYNFADNSGTSSCIIQNISNAFEVDVEPPGSISPNEQVGLFDLIRIQRHILGTTPFPSPYHYIAADVNNSGSITALDQIKIRKVILGIDSDFSPVDNFRYLPTYSLTDDAFFEAFQDDPFIAEWDRQSQLYSYLALQPNKSYLDPLDLTLSNPDLFFSETWGFNAVKTGNADLLSDDDQFLSTSTLLSSAPQGQIINSGESFQVSINLLSIDSLLVQGYQLSLDFDTEFVEIDGLLNGDTPFSTDNFNFLSGSQEGELELRHIWFSETLTPRSLTPRNFESIFNLQLTAKQQINTTNLTEIISLGLDSLPPRFINTGNETVPIILSMSLNTVNNSNKQFVQSIFPNPATNQVSFSIESLEMANANITLWDQFGNSLQINSVPLQIGQNTISSNSLGNLQNGTIYYNISTNTTSLTGYFLKF